jgi:cell division cycle 14
VGPDLFQWGQEADEQNQCVFFWCSAEPKKKSNAAVLVGAYLVLFGGVEAEAAYQTLSRFQPFMPFRDPTCGISTYHLSVYDCIQAISKAQKLDWIDFNNFRLDEYEYFEQVKNGDLNWMVPGKLMAFSGPSARRLEVLVQN